MDEVDFCVDVDSKNVNQASEKKNPDFRSNTVGELRLT